MSIITATICSAAGRSFSVKTENVCIVYFAETENIP